MLSRKVIEKTTKHLESINFSKFWNTFLESNLEKILGWPSKNFYKINEVELKMLIYLLFLISIAS